MPFSTAKTIVGGTATCAESLRPKLALLYSAPIGLLGGLIGLGGAEFRLPVLAGPLGYSARQAVPLNLAVTLVTILASLGSRGASLSFGSVDAYLHVILALIFGSVMGAFLGSYLAGRLSERQFERVILVLLLGLGGGLILDSVVPHESSGTIFDAVTVQVGAGLLFGLAIGLVSSLLGVAGGELLIPTLVFVFGANIKTAGTASLLISVPMVVVGLLAHARLGAFTDRRVWGDTIWPMSVGSLLGAVTGGLLVNSVPSAMLKAVLGGILIYSAVRVFLKGRSKKVVFEKE